MKINVTKPSLPPFEEYCDEIKQLWKSCWVTNFGALHDEFCDKLKEKLGVENVALFVNGHASLELAIAAFHFPKGSEIITTPFTFVSTVNAIVRNGLTPVFCDINKDDFTIDENKIENLVTKDTAAILGVHVYGNICHVDAIEKIAKKHNLKVIYDAAHAFGETYRGVGIGNYGDVSMFSFHATKVFNSIEGGCLSYKDASYNKFFHEAADFGLSLGEEEDCHYCGGNFKMNEFQSAMGLCNLRHVSEYIRKRKHIVDLYTARLSSIKGISLCLRNYELTSNYSYFPVVFDGYKYSRDEIREILASKGIYARKYFYPLVNDFDCYKNFEHGETPIAKHISNCILALPLYPDLTDGDINHICDLILG